MDDDGDDPLGFAVVPNVVGMTTWAALHHRSRPGVGCLRPGSGRGTGHRRYLRYGRPDHGQHPTPGTVARRFTAVEIWVDGGGAAGVRELRRPPPRSSAGAGEGYLTSYPVAVRLSI